MTVEQNPARLKHLMRLHGLSVSALLERISEGLKKPITEADLFAHQVKLSILKKADKLFEKGLHYYLDPKDPIGTPESSVFFRKQHFNTELNLGARKVVTRFEEFKISLSAIAKLADLEFSRVLPVCTLNHDPKAVAMELRASSYPTFDRDQRGFLKALIGSLSEKNVLVFEFVEQHNLKDKANIDGFFLKPNVIVLKRQQRSFRREIFTLAHELGHYLLGEEEVEELKSDYMARKDLSAIENWCNEFAFQFLAGKHASALEVLEPAGASNDYHRSLVELMSQETHLSRIALYTRMLLSGAISNVNYGKVKRDLDEEYRRSQLELDKERVKQRLLDEQGGRSPNGRAPQPIKSPLLVSTIQAAFHEGVMSEFEVREKWKITPHEFEKYFE